MKFAKKLMTETKIVRAEQMFATDANLAGYGYLVSDPSTVEVEIVTWPTAGWRPVDEGTGNEAGTTEGDFDFWWNAYFPG